ncbi:MAG: efflux RND transporter periplasmic adaptor subunit, partial [Candidatus Eiseniibacteriota bacterium]
MKKGKWLWIGLGILIVVSLTALNVVRQIQGKIVPVQFARVRVEDITSRVRAPGKIEAKLQVKISADLPGKVQRLLVKEGDRVKRGQLMLQLDDTQYRSALDQSHAALSSGEARLREALAAQKVSDSNIERQRSLFAQKLLSQAEWDQATSANESAHVAVATAREEISRAQAAQA